MGNSIKIGDTVNVGGKHISVNFSIDEFIAAQKEGSSQLNENYSPVAIKKLGSSSMNNIIITGDFITDCIQSNIPSFDGMSYIAVRKNSIGEALAHCGYGIAFRPSSPDASESSQIDGNITDNGDGTYDITIDDVTGFKAGLMFVEDSNGHKVSFYCGNINEGTDTLEDCALPSNLSPGDTDDVYMAEANVFAVDNDLIGSDIYNHKQIEHNNGVLSYIKSAVTEILPDTKYYYAMTISASNDITFELGTDPDNLSTVISSTGAYTPIAEYLETPNMDAFGLSVVNTHGYKWTFGPVKIANLAYEYPIMFYDMDVTDLTENFRAYLKGIGYGYDSGAGTYGLALYAYACNISNPEWVNIASGSDEIAGGTNELMESIVLSKSDYSDSGIVHFYCSPIYASGSEGDKNAYINIDTFYLESTANQSVHMNSMVDVYIDDHNLKYLEKSGLEIANGIISFGSDRAVIWVESVTYVSEENSVELSQGLDYIWAVNDEDYRGATNVGNYIQLSTLPATGTYTVKYYYSPAVEVASTKIPDIYTSYKAQDIIVKHMPLYVIEYSITEDTDIAEHIDNYLTSLTPDSDDNLMLRYQALREYVLNQATVTGFAIDIYYYEDGYKMQKTSLLDVGDEISIPKQSTYKVKELIYAG